MKRVLITGASGFIGGHCLPLLVTNGYEVHAVSTREAPPADAAGIIWHRCNLLEPPRVDDLLASVRPTHLLHLAWYAVPHKFWSSTENLQWVQASLNLVHAFARHDGRRFVASGSCAEYDWAAGHCSETTTPLRPATLYGACKLGFQIVLEAYCRQFGLTSAWGRIFFLYGPNEPPEKFVASIISSFLRGQPARCSHGDQIRDFLHVRDVARAFVTLLDSETSGAMNIASAEPIALKTVARRIAEKMGCMPLLQLGALAARSGEPPVLTADNTRLKVETAWKMSYDLESGLNETIAWWKANLASHATI